MKKTISFVLILILSPAYVNLAAEDTWTRKTDMPTARFGLSTSVVDGKIYAIGGGKTPYGAYLSPVEEYDPATDTWTKKADMPTARSGHAAGVVNGKIYVIGGEPSAQASIPTVEEYDPATDTWTRKSDMPTERTFLSTCVVDGKIYAIGGVTAPGGGWPSSVEVYDPATDTWTTKADIPTARSMAAASVVDGKIYVIGGVIGDVVGAGISIVEEYDPAMDTWTRKANMPTGRKVLSTSVVDRKIYAIGGATGMTVVFSTVEEYDPATDTWTRKADMPTARSLHSTSAVNGKIYAIGGSVQCWPWTPTSTVEEYNPPISLVVDFNGDGVVDCADICIMVDHWGTDEPMCDIAPPPFGDGIVDIYDLIILAEHLTMEVDVDANDAGSQVELEQGQILVVTLESNPTTGYRWEQAENQESYLEQMGEAEFKPSETGEPPLVGAGGWEIFRFKAISAGQMTLQLVYHRPWEEGVEPLKTFSIQVVVR